MLSGRARFEAWKQKFETQWNQGTARLMAGAMWAGLAPEQQNTLATMNPDLATRVQEMISRRR